MSTSSSRVVAIAALVALLTPVEGRHAWGSSIRHNPRYDSYWPRRIMHRRLNSASTLENFLSDVFPNLYNGNTLLRQSQRASQQQQKVQREEEDTEAEERSTTATTTTTTPRYDITETDDSYELMMEIPGVSVKDLTVELEDNSVLRIQGSRRGFGPSVTFEQSFVLQDVDTDRIMVNLSNGLLKITAPKRAPSVVRLGIQQVTGDEEEQSSSSSLSSPPSAMDMIGKMTRQEPGMDKEVIEVASARQDQASSAKNVDEL